MRTGPAERRRRADIDGTKQIGRRGILAGASALPLLRPGHARAQGTTLRVGVLNDMSGTYRDSTGPLSALCVRQAVEDFAAMGTGINVEMLTGDHQNKPDVGADMAWQWLDRDGVSAMLVRRMDSEKLPAGWDAGHALSLAQSCAVCGPEKDGTTVVNPIQADSAPVLYGSILYEAAVHRSPRVPPGPSEEPSVTLDCPAIISASWPAATFSLA